MPGSVLPIKAILIGDLASMFVLSMTAGGPSRRWSSLMDILRVLFMTLKLFNVLVLPTIRLFRL